MGVMTSKRVNNLLIWWGVSVFGFSVFAISIPQLRAHAGAVAGSRLE